MRRGAFGPEDTYDKMSEYLRKLPSLLPAEPKAVLVVSAHWEEEVVTVQSAASPPLLFDYSGFPKETYEVTWPAPGAPSVAARIKDLLAASAIEIVEDEQRGYDHGTFVPLSLTYPEPSIPTLQLSLRKGLDPEEHLRVGRALSPLRDEGVFIVGSGMSYHNMGGFFGRVPSIGSDSASFQDWLRTTVTAEVHMRNDRLARWYDAPYARACHPRQEHLLPLMVVAGSAGEGVGEVPYEDVLMGAHVLAAHFS
jgi:aromatic ring-opening dioxygenase catalytic subunit (LigB family)